MTTGPVERPGKWALPPEPPETWVGKRAHGALVTGAALAVASPTLFLPGGGAATALLAASYAVGGLLALSSAYLLVLQASVTQDRRLLWAAGGFATVLGLYLVRSLDPAVPGRPGTGAELALAGALSVGWLLALPLMALTAALRRVRLVLYVVPLALLTGAVLASYQTSLVRTDGGQVTGLGRAVAVGAGAVGVAGALWWRRRVPNGNRGAWGWVGAALLLTPVVAVLRAASVGGHDPTSWASLVVEDLVLAVPALGLFVLTQRGYLTQARRWRQLDAEVRRLSASSALLPGLSITPEDERGLPERDEVESLLARQDHQVALQPVFDLATMTVVGQEALARFGGRVPTDRWFRGAGQHGLGMALERRTLSASLAALDGMADGQFLAINASPAALHDDEVLRMLADHDLSRLIVEITEHEAVNDYALTRQALATLRANGARIAVDDVGAGFASLRHVLLLQPDVVKLDTSLIRDVHDSSRQAAIVRALVTFCNEVGAVVLAEGIEVSEQIPALVDVGVTLGQGWHLGIPVLVSQQGTSA